jgi:hypothetical protein
VREPFQAAVLVVVAAATLVTQGVLSAATAEGCRSTPGGLTPTGSHWVYRIDRFSQRRCWFLRSSASGMGRGYSLRHRHTNIGGTADRAIAQPEETDDNVVARSSPPQKSLLIANQQSEQELTVTDPDAQASDILVPHKVKSISYTPLQAQERSVRRGMNIDLAFLCGALATGLVLAGGALQVVPRIQPRSRALSLTWKSSTKANASNDDLSFAEKLERTETRLGKLHQRLRQSDILSSEIP